MKKLLFILSITFFSTTLLAQNYFPFPDSNAVWTIAHISLGQYVGNYKYAVAGDTLINSNWYKKVYECADTVFNMENASYYGAFRDSNKKWLAIPNFATNEYLLYDYGVIQGDTIEIDNPWALGICEIRIDGIDSILINGQYRKQYHTQLLPANENPLIWIEGIGSVKGLYYPAFPFTCHDSKLLCFEENDTIKYMNSPNNTCYYVEVGIEEKINESEFHIYPNPTSSTFSISGNYELPVIVQLYDIAGRQVKQLTINQEQLTIDVSTLSKGIYVWHLGAARGKLVVE